MKVDGAFIVLSVSSYICCCLATLASAFLVPSPTSARRPWRPAKRDLRVHSSSRVIGDARAVAQEVCCGASGGSAGAVDRRSLIGPSVAALVALGLGGRRAWAIDMETYEFAKVALFVISKEIGRQALGTKHTVIHTLICVCVCVCVWKEGGNIERMKKDIDKGKALTRTHMYVCDCFPFPAHPSTHLSTGNFEDLIAFTRKYNGVLSQEMSNANKIFTDEAKKEGKSLKERARDHLIDINQSARRRSAEGCNAGLEGLKKDLVDFTKLAQVEPPS